jgi:integrase
MKLNDRTVKNLKPKLQRYEFWESNGLGVRVTPAGNKSWVYMYRLDGRQRRLTLGRYPKMTVAQAHAAHGTSMEKVERGIDPANEMVSKNITHRSSPTVKELAEIYIKKWAIPRKRTWKQDEGYLQKNVLPEWGLRKASDIRRKDTIKLLDEIVARGSPITANRVLEVVRKMYNFGIERDLVESNPCTMVRAPTKERRRERVLSESEIISFWTGLNSAQFSEPVKIAIKILLFTAQRRGEVATMSWDDLELDTGWWTIPSEKAKNGLSHRVPLTEPVIKLLKAAESLSDSSKWVFSSTRGKGEFSINPAALTRAIARSREHYKIESFGPHDLRRTAASHMASLGVARLVLGKILNHVDSSVTAVYDRHSYDMEKQAALTTWSAKIIQLTDEINEH